MVQIMDNVSSKITDKQMTLTVCGEIDHHSAKEIRRKMDALILANFPKDVRLDLSEVTFMDSSGLGLIMGRYSLVSDLGGRICVLNPTDGVARIMLMAGLEKIVPIEREKI